MTHRLDVRRGLGLILIMLGLALPLIYFANQAAQPAPRSTLAPTEISTTVIAAVTPTATRIVERLIPDRADQNADGHGNSRPRTATSTATADPRDRPRANRTATPMVRHGHATAH